MDPLEVVRRFFQDVWNGRRLELLDELVDPNCVTHQLRSVRGSVESLPRGPAALREHIAGWLKAFPDISVTTDLQTALGPNVVSWVTMRGEWPHCGRLGNGGGARIVPTVTPCPANPRIACRRSLKLDALRRESLRLTSWLHASPVKP